MKVTAVRAAELARQAGIDALPKKTGSALHVRFMLGEDEVRMGLTVPLSSIEDASRELDFMRVVKTKPYLGRQADAFIALLEEEEAALA